VDAACELFLTAGAAEALETAAELLLGLTTCPLKEIGILLPNNQRQHRTLHIQKGMLPYALC